MSDDLCHGVVDKYRHSLSYPVILLRDHRKPAHPFGRDCQRSIGADPSRN